MHVTESQKFHNLNNDEFGDNCDHSPMNYSIFGMRAISAGITVHFYILYNEQMILFAVCK